MVHPFSNALLGLVLLSLGHITHQWSAASVVGLAPATSRGAFCPRSRGAPNTQSQNRPPPQLRMLMQGAGEFVEMKATKHTAKFDEMVARISNYTEIEKAAVRDKQMRAVLAGITDGVQDRQVYQAFRILYEDFGPIRFAGDAVFKILDSMVKSEGSKLRESIEKRGAPVDAGAIAKSRQIFELADKDRSGFLDRDEVAQLLSGLQEVGYQGPMCTDAFMDQIDYDKNGLVGFDELFSGIGDLFVVGEEELECYFSKLSSVWEGKASASLLDKSNSKYVERYMTMLRSIQEWEEILEHDKSMGKKEGRLQAVLRGCIAGSHRPAVVEALKIVYVDWPGPVRLAGDLIFKLMAKLMSKRGN